MDLNRGEFHITNAIIFLIVKPVRSSYKGNVKSSLLSRVLKLGSILESQLTETMADLGFMVIYTG